MRHLGNESKYGVQFIEAMRRFDEENAQDPNRILVDGVDRAHELWYAQRVTDWILRLDPDASEPLLLLEEPSDPTIEIRIPPAPPVDRRPPDTDTKAAHLQRITELQSTDYLKFLLAQRSHHTPPTSPLAYPGVG